MKPLKFVHISKTAGTTIEEEAKRGGILWGINHIEYGWHHDRLANKPQTLREKYDWFTVVRNPYTRIISEFHCKWGGMGGIGPDKLKKVTEEEFNNFLICNIENVDRIRGNHYTPQHDYIDNEIPIIVLKFENLKTEFDRLMKKYKLPVTLESRENVGYKVFNYSNINQKLHDLINKTYEKDFEHFDYDIKDYVKGTG